MSDKKYTPSVIPPGNVQAKINSIELRDRPYKTKEGDIITDVVLNLETKPITDVTFKGLKYDYTNPASATYKGQVARVRLNEWGFKDVNRTDFTITKEDDILRHLKSLFMETGQLAWFTAQDDKMGVKDIKRFIEAINKDQPFKDFYMYYCLASRQYINKNNYKTDDIFLPKYDKEVGKPFSVEMKDLIQFNIEKHVTPPKTKEVTSFEPVKETPTNTETTTTATTQNGQAVNNPLKNEEEDINWEKADERNKEILEKEAKAKEHTEAVDNFMNQAPVKKEEAVVMPETNTGIVSGGAPNEKLPWEE